MSDRFNRVAILQHFVNAMRWMAACRRYWGRDPKDVPSVDTREYFAKHITNVAFVDASALAWPPWHRPLMEGAEWSKEDGWKFKAFVMYKAPYRHALFLDADAAAALDPADLFQYPAYIKHGSMFWPELWYV